MAAGGLALAALAGCMVGPNFHPPQPNVPAAWVGPTPGAPATAADQALAQWWTAFQDPVLVSLVERAASSNLGLKQAESRVRQARAARGVAAGGLGPALDASASLRRSQSPGGGGQTAPATNLYQAGFDAAWEIDIFGGVRRGVEAADADLLGSVEARRDVLVSLAAEIALNYVDLRSFQQRIEIAQRNLKVQQHTADLTRRRFEGGFVSRLDVAIADAQVATTAAQIPVLEGSARQTIYSLSVLVGREPGALVEELAASAVIPAAPPSVPVGVPSDLLRRRPDIREAEVNIHAATARIGVATADLFPKVSLSGSVGFQAGQIDSWFNGGSRFWGLGPSVTWRVFDTGRILSNVEVQKALEEQSVLAYRQTVLVALQEVENALIASTKEEEHRQSLTQAVAANRKAVDLATQLYVEGQTDFLNVLDAQRSLYASEDALAQSNATASTDLIALYKALGGGWQDQPPAQAAR